MKNKYLHYTHWDTLKHLNIMDNDLIRHILDAISVGVIFSTIVGWLPSIAALLSIIWLGIQIYDRVKNGYKGKYDKDAGL